MPPGVGALTEADGRCLMMLLDMGRYLVNEITQEHKFSSLTDVSILRQSRMDIVMDLTGKMWSYWHSAPAGPGVYEMMLDWCKQQAPSAKSIRKREIGIAEKKQMTTALHLLASRELKSWPRQRVTGYFFFVKEAANGAAILIDENMTHVYSVLGISCSIGELLRSNGQSPPACLGLTLIPFMSSIVYDGTLKGKQLPPRNDIRAELNAAVALAEREGKILTQLPTPVDAPLEGKPVRISGLQAKPELNGQIARAGEFDGDKGRYAVQLSSGTRVALKPVNLTEVTEAELEAAAPEGTRVGSPLTPFQLEVQQEVSAMAPMAAGATMPGPDGRPADINFWVFRRHGYTERDNPEFTFMIMAGPMPLPATDAGGGGPMSMMMDPNSFWHKCAALVPTVDEILRAFRNALKSSAWAGRGKPEFIAVDAKEIVSRLEEILKPTGVKAGYYPPPSDEELNSMHNSRRM